MSEENEPKRPIRSSARPTRGGAKSGARRPRQSSGGNQGKIIGAIVLTVVVIIGAAFGMGAFDSGDSKEDDKKAKESAVKDTTKIDDAKDSTPSIFDAGKTTGKTAGPKKRERVSGRDPKTLDMKKMTKHLGHLYIDETLAKSITDLEKEVTQFKRERWDVSKELKAKYRSLTSTISTAKSHKFLSGADDALVSFNTFTKNREVHLKGEDGNLLPNAFVGVAHDPFVIMVQAHKDGGEKEIADEVHDWMVQLKAEFVRYFTGTLKLEPSVRHPLITIVLFRTMKDYNNYNRIKNPERDITFALAHYEPDNRRLCVPLDFGALGGGKDKKHTFREVMFHEGTHQVMHFFTKKDHLGAWGSMWSDEGVAEYFAGHAIEDKKIKFGRINSRIQSVAMDRKDEKSRINMIELLTWTRFKMTKAREKGPEKEREGQRIHSHVYSQGWALVYFMNNYKNGIYKAQFLDLMKRQLDSGDAGLPMFRKVFKDDEFDKIEVEYFDYLDKLTDAYTNKEIKNHTWVQ